MARARSRTTVDAAERTLPHVARAGAPRAPSATSQSIFAATEELLRTVALADLTVEQILQQAGVSRTTFYKNFGSKYTVVSAMLGELQGELVDVMQPWFFRRRRPPTEALHDALTAVAELWRQHRPVLRAGTENWHVESEVGQPWAAMMNRFVTDIARQIDAERRAGTAPDGVESTALARTLVWSSERMLYLAGFGICGERLELDAVEALVAVWVGTIYQSV